jgi:hypothetical protein
MEIPHKMNVEGDFYVEDGCCLTCGVPVDIAPDIFEYEEHSCYVKKQPITPDELERTLEVMNNQEVDCIHYKGTDREIVRRLVESGEGNNCDSRLREFFQEKVRDVARVTFPSNSAAVFIDALAAKARIEKGYGSKSAYQFKQVVVEGDSASIAVSWYNETFHTLVVTRQEADTFVLQLKAAMRLADHGFSRLIHRWLLTLPDASAILWMTEEEFRTGGGQPAPF